MKIAVYGKLISPEARPYIEKLYHMLKAEGVELIFYAPFHQHLVDHCDIEIDYPTYSSSIELIASQSDVMLSIGGDGTILDAATLVRNSGIPILGVNTGRLGFLADVAREEVNKAAKALLKGKYTVQNRNLISVSTSSPDIIPDPNFALNEIAVSRKDTTSMITVHTWINDEYLNSYWADGLIIATPTGSTGYSLSCGGPIIMPGSENFVITPIAPHNLTVRPFVIPNHYKIRLKVETREDRFLTSVDSRIYACDSEVEIFLERADFKIGTIQTEVQNFPSTLRNKLLWGLDRRN
ncbi:MAG: NAD kinase [Bacteroidetes bacterium]|uniref:NAD kinase n=1 Tax=Phaeocystidibacter marisrubri TaxID=1577780 RepID=A0A6L3ZC94_9FLAO|nr:NAD kinase [Phaeocystidibacter marisrubri]KAB2815284.1 NAD kinase [Phaeocystidibacter marisrubri]TNE31556.1 MAG: NAD kinase [Bacteroidota bacterium]GGH71301.1 NAD kinase [Phaeocystidibacter marisrubri]